MNHSLGNSWTILLVCLLIQGHVTSYSSLRYISHPRTTVSQKKNGRLQQFTNRYHNPSYLFSHEENTSADQNTKGTFLHRIKERLVGKGKPSDGLTTRQRLAKMGLSTLLSYGFVSNMTLCVTVSLAWFSFNKKVPNYILLPFGIYISSSNRF
jgi:hypothetical protein